MLPSFGITPAAYTMRLAYNGCTNLTASTAADIKSYCDVERAAGGVGDCTEKPASALRVLPTIPGILFAPLPALSLVSAFVLVSAAVLVSDAACAFPLFPSPPPRLGLTLQL
ncbi:unnamed protein product [Closterium sp. NIES-53]